MPAPRFRRPGPTLTVPSFLNGTPTPTGKPPAAPVRLNVAPARLLKRLSAGPTQSEKRPLLLALLLTTAVKVEALFTTVPSPMQMLPATHDVGPFRFNVVPLRIAAWNRMPRFAVAGTVIVPPPPSDPPVSTGWPVRVRLPPGATLSLLRAALRLRIVDGWVVSV